ncbi:hypothetical protein AB6880_16705 [Rahnella inusitata]|uniref:hypothetical protein n=1 Tax=Rahnella inusitata TaxID=58169 RepID=UPI0039BDE0EA
MYQIRTMDISPVNPMLYLPGAPVCPEEPKGKMQRRKLMQNQINNIEKQGIKHGEEIASLNLRMGKVEQQLGQLTDVVTDTNLRVGKLEQQVCHIKEVVTEMNVRVEARFEKIDQRFEKIDQRFDKIDQRFEKIDQRFARMDERFNALDVAVTKIPAIFAENAMKQNQSLIRVIQWIVSLMVVLVGVTFTAARYIH